MEGCMIMLNDTVAAALEVIAGKYGNDEDRVRALQAAGFDYRKVQMCVNDLLILCEKYKD